MLSMLLEVGIIFHQLGLPLELTLYLQAFIKSNLIYYNLQVWFPANNQTLSVDIQSQMSLPEYDDFSVLF